MNEPSPEVKAFAYVTGELKANEIFDLATAKRDHLARVHDQITEGRKRRRELEVMLHDREMVIAEEVFAQNRDQSQAARDRLLKVALNNDGDVRETKEELATLAWEIDAAEFEAEQINQDIKIAVARMHELQGLLQFMAVVKQAELTRQHIERQGPWA